MCPRFAVIGEGPLGILNDQDSLLATTAGWSVRRSDAMANGRFDEKGPLIGDVARHVDDGAVSFGFQVLLVL